VASFEMTCDGVFGGPCPVCGGSGELLAQKATYGGIGRCGIWMRPGRSRCARCRRLRVWCGRQPGGGGMCRLMRVLDSRPGTLVWW